MTNEKRVELTAEYKLLYEYDKLRSRKTHDFGSGARGNELHRRFRDLGAHFAEEDAVTTADLKAAYERVGRRRYRRAMKDYARYGTRAARYTREAWAEIERRVYLGAVA